MKNQGYIVGLGFCGHDYLCIVPRIPVDDKVQAVQTLEQGGGPAATGVCAAARLGAKVSFIGAVGDDQRGQMILQGLAREGIDTSGIKIRLASESPVAYCWIEESTGKRSIAWSHGSARPLLPEEIRLVSVCEAGLLHLDGHQPQAAIYAAKAARKSDTTVMLDAGTVTDGIDEILDLSDIIIASEKFAERYTGIDNPEESLKKLFGKNAKFVAVTLGNQGCIGYDGKNFYHQSIFDVEVVDTTGAGDVFHGAFGYKYVNGGNWQECLRFASAVSALKCTRFGGRTGIPTLSETEQFLKERI